MFPPVIYQYSFCYFKNSYLFFFFISVWNNFHDKHFFSVHFTSNEYWFFQLPDEYFQFFFRFRAGGLGICGEVDTRVLIYDSFTCTQHTCKVPPDEAVRLPRKIIQVMSVNCKKQTINTWSLFILRCLTSVFERFSLYIHENENEWKNRNIKRLMNAKGLSWRINEVHVV